MKRVLFLQDLGVERQVIQDLIAQTGLPLTATWDNWQRVDTPEEVVAIVTVAKIRVAKNRNACAKTTRVVLMLVIVPMVAAWNV